MLKKFLFLFMSCLLTNASNLFSVDIQKLTEIINHPCEWMVEQLEEDFQDTKTISLEGLQYMYDTLSLGMFIYEQPSNHVFCRYRIINNELYVHEGDEYKIQSYITGPLQQLLSVMKVPDVEFIYCNSDGVPESYHRPNFWIMDKAEYQTPIFVRGKKEGDRFSILFPCSSNVIVKEPLVERYSTPSWNLKLNRIVWRGSDSDVPLSTPIFQRPDIDMETLKNAYFSVPRIFASTLSVLHPDVIDAGIVTLYTTIWTRPQLKRDLLLEWVNNLKKGFLSLEQQLFYKYILILDGHFCTYPRYMEALCANSVVIKPQAKNIQCFYKAVKPYIHVLPVKEDLSDLLEIYQWAIEHDAECKQMSENASALAINELNQEHFLAYAYLLLQKYAKLQNFSLKPTCEWKKL